jgi:hypothetical protein
MFFVFNMIICFFIDLFRLRTDAKVQLFFPENLIDKLNVNQFVIFMCIGNFKS